MVKNPPRELDLSSSEKELLIKMVLGNFNPFKIFFIQGSAIVKALQVCKRSDIGF